MTQSMPLFHQPKDVFMKLAAETALPEDPNMWQDEVLQEIYKQVPYLSDFNLEVVMETVDGERGYGLGHVEVVSKSEAPMTSPQAQQDAAGIRKARVPVIIKDGKLAPFDVIITDDSKAMPLTESRMRQVMFRPQAFDVTSKTPGDQSMVSQLYPPYRQNYGFGGGSTSSAGMGGKTAARSDLESYIESLHKTASKDIKGTPVAKLEGQAKTPPCEVKTGSVLEAVLQTVREDDLLSFKESLQDQNTKLAFARNVATYEAIERIAAAEPITLEKRASFFMANMKPSVMQISKIPGGYQLKTASHRVWSPVTELLDRGQLVHRVGTKIALAVDQTGSVTLGAEAGAQEAEAAPLPVAGPISAPGMYRVSTTSGEELTGAVIPNLVDVTGSALPIALFMDGQNAAVQSDMVGVPVGDYAAPATVPAEQAQGYGCFYSEESGAPTATLPIRIGATLAGNGVDDLPKYEASTFDGRELQVSVQPYAKRVVNVDGLMIIPQGWAWMPLEQAAEVEIAETVVPKTAARLSSVEVIAGSADSYSVRGVAVEKLAMDDRQFLSQDDCLFLLTGLGADPKYAQQKMAAALGRGPQQVSINHHLKLAAELRGESYTTAAGVIDSTPTYRHRMWKEAATLPDPIAVDSVLSLGFINPENLATFVGYLPTLDEAQRRLCELLIAARLGMQELSEGAIERAIRALEDVLEGLKVVAFQG